MTEPIQVKYKRRDGEVRTYNAYLEHLCPKCGAPGIQCCAGCSWPTDDERDCGCPAGTAYTCSARCFERKMHN
jgi:hypothetical protein